MALVAALLAVVEPGEDRIGLRRRDPVDPSPDLRARLRQERRHAPRRAGHAAVVGRALVEFARPAFEVAVAVLDVVEVWAPDE